jgi:hypothetical protein
LKGHLPRPSPEDLRAVGAISLAAVIGEPHPHHLGKLSLSKLPVKVHDSISTLVGFLGRLGVGHNFTLRTSPVTIPSNFGLLRFTRRSEISAYDRAEPAF